MMRLPLLLSAGLLLGLASPRPAAADWKAQVESLAGRTGIVYAVDGQGRTLLSLRGEQSFVPASTLKVITTLLAAEHLGLDSRFETEFFVVDEHLLVRGKGDPFLVSEELDLLVKDLAPKLEGLALKGVRVDDSWFEGGIEIPGVGGTENPYDALNSATAVNFNTVYVDASSGRVRSAEEQTPLTPLAVEVAKRRGLRGKERVNLSSDPKDVRRYAAELIAAKLRGAGVQVGEGWGEGAAPEGEPLHVHRNSRTIGEVCAGLLYYSNNYIANQVFLAVGAAVEGAPASLDKSVRVAERWIAGRPELKGLKVMEGSGIAYTNEATAASFVAALGLLAPHKDLLRVQHGSPSKTGTLKVTKTLVGYLDTKDAGTVRYVISLDGGGAQRRWQIVDAMAEGLGGLAKP